MQLLNASSNAYVTKQSNNQLMACTIIRSYFTILAVLIFNIDWLQPIYIYLIGLSKHKASNTTII